MSSFVSGSLPWRSQQLWQSGQRHFHKTWSLSFDSVGIWNTTPPTFIGVSTTSSRLPVWRSYNFGSIFHFLARRSSESLTELSVCTAINYKPGGLNVPNLAQHPAPTTRGGAASSEKEGQACFVHREPQDGMGKCGMAIGARYQQILFHSEGVSRKKGRFLQGKRHFAFKGRRRFCFAFDKEYHHQRQECLFYPLPTYPLHEEKGAAWIWACDQGSQHKTLESNTVVIFAGYLHIKPEWLERNPFLQGYRLRSKIGLLESRSQCQANFKNIL